MPSGVSDRRRPKRFAIDSASCNRLNFHEFLFFTLVRARKKFSCCKLLYNAALCSSFVQELHLQFVPINLHLQRCQTYVSDLDEQVQPLDIYTVGAFAAHALGYDHGGLRPLDPAPATTTGCLARTWRAMRGYFRISDLVTRLDVQMRSFSALLSGGDERQAARVVADMDRLAERLVEVLDPQEVEQALLSLESLRMQDENAKSAKVSSEQHSELEPVDLLHLNIRASLISIASKLNSTRQATISDCEPSKRKLQAAMNALQRTAALVYAIEAVKLEREQLEQFYTMRLRRAMVFSQALTCKCRFRVQSSYIKRLRSYCSSYRGRKWRCQHERHIPGAVARDASGCRVLRGIAFVPRRRNGDAARYGVRRKRIERLRNF